MFMPQVIPLTFSEDAKIPVYKLYYFDARGLGETTRQLFVLAGQPFEDVRYSIEEWKKHKNEMPFEQIPVLEVDGQKIPQSFAIARYVAKQFGYAGKDDFDAALVDAFGDQFKDYFDQYRPLHQVLIGFKQGDKEKLRKEIGEPARDNFFSLVERQLMYNQSGFLVGDSVTWADLLIAEHVDALLAAMPDYLADYPAVLAHHERVQLLPKLKEWLEKRPWPSVGCPACSNPAAAAHIIHHPLLTEYMERKAKEEQLIDPARCVGPTTHFQAAQEGQAH